MLGGFIVPIIPGLFAFGYILRVLRSSADGEPPSMPAWDDWASLFSLGLRGAIINFVFLLPSFVAFLIGLAAYLSSLLVIPLSESGGDYNVDAFFGLFFLGMGVMLLSMAVGSVLFILGTIPLPVSLTHFVAKDRLGAGFRIRVIGVLGIAYAAFFVLYSTLILLCFAFLIIAPIGFYAMLVGASLFGDAYREGRSLILDRE
jgi:hypothetical protein